MNVNFICVARNVKGRALLPTLADSAIAHVDEVFGESDKNAIHRTSGMVAFNANRMGRTWTVPTWLEENGEIYGFSQPPVPLNQEVTSSTWSQTIVAMVRRAKQNEFLINHFGYRVRRDHGVEVWTDILGFGRCYMVENDEFVAISNHIGMVSFFLQKEVQIDDAAVGKFANFGWFSGSSTPFVGIERVPAAARINVGQDGSITRETYLPLRELVGARDQPVDFADTVRQSRVVARNLDNLSHKTPTVYLSGGQDSRMTAGLWLSGGSSANVVTLGVLEREVEIARQLLDIYAGRVDFQAQGITHRVTEPKPSGVTMPIEERLAKAFDMWDGDAAPTNMKTNVRPPASAAALSIGGTNGEITHGYFYSRPGLTEQISKLPHPLKRLERVYSGNVPTEFAHSLLPDFFDEEYEQASSAGQSGLASLDVFYLREKLRRWHNQSLNTTSTVLLGTAAYIRAAYDLTVQQRIDKLAPRTLAKLAIPEWDGVPYYKAQAAESKVANNKGLRTWHIDAEYFRHTIQSPKLWNRYLKNDRLTHFLQLVDQNEAVGSHESWFNRAIWIDFLPEHVSRLNRVISSAKNRALA